MGAVQSSSSAGQDPGLAKMESPGDLLGCCASPQNQGKSGWVAVQAYKAPRIRWAKTVFAPQNCCAREAFDRDECAQRSPGSLIRLSSEQSLKSLNAAFDSDKRAQKPPCSLIRSSSEQSLKSLNAMNIVDSDHSKRAQKSGGILDVGNVVARVPKRPKAKGAKTAQGSLVRSSSLTSLTKKEERAIKAQAKLDTDFQRSRQETIANSLRW